MFQHSGIHSRARTAAWSGAVVMTASMAIAGAAEASPARPIDHAEAPFSRPCFMVRSHWNEAIDGAQPTCPVPPRAAASNRISGEPAPAHEFMKRTW